MKDKVLRIAQRTKRVIVWMIKLITGILSFFVTPLGLTVLILCFGALTIVSLTQILGQEDYTVTQYSNQAPRLENVKDEDRMIYTAAYLQAQGFPSTLANYIAQVGDYQNFTYISDGEGCDASCQLERIDKSVSVGAWKVSGLAAQKTFQNAVIMNLPYTDSRVQLTSMRDVYREHVDKITVAEDETDLYTQQVNELYGIHPKNSKELLSKTKDIQVKVDKIISAFMPRTGLKNGRIKGANNLDGSSSSTGSIDTSDMIAFLESFCLDHKVTVGFTTGEAEATDNMKKAKQQAEERGGKDDGRWYASCDRLVATAYKGMNIDPQIPWGGALVIGNYLASHTDKWKEVTDEKRESGDVLVYRENGCHHVALYGVNAKGEKMLYQASHYGGGYPGYLPMKTPVKDENVNDLDYMHSKCHYYRFIGKKGESK